MGVLRTILILLLIYFGVRLLFYWLAPKLFGYAAKKAEARFRETFERYQQAQDPDSAVSGQVTVEKTNKKRNKDKEKVGEYIEFEEIE